MMTIMATRGPETFQWARPHKTSERWVLPAVWMTERGMSVSQEIREGRVVVVR